MKAEHDEVQQFLAEHPEWALDGEALHRSLTFKGFSRAFGFMSEIALHAAAQHHHPEWRNSYNRVDIWLTTHEFNGISERDFRLARTIDRALLGDVVEHP